MARKVYTAPVATLLVLVLASCSVIGDKKPRKSNRNSGQGNAQSNDDAVTGQGDAPAGTQSFDINKTVWYAGLKLTFGKLTYDPAKEYPETPLTIDTTVENVAPTSAESGLPFTIKANDTFIEGRFDGDFRIVPTGETGRTTVEFDVYRSQQVGDLSAGELQVGGGESVNAIVPFAPSGQVVDLAPRALLDKPVSKSTRTGKLTYQKCSLQADLPSAHEEVEKDMRTVVCYLDMQQTVAKAEGELVGDRNFMLRIPDGSVVPADEAPGEVFYKRQRITDQELVFKIRWPAPGDYRIEVEFGDGKSSLPLTITDV